MRQIGLAAATVGLMGIATLGLAGTATASAPPTGNLANVIAQLEADGHHVQLNGSSHHPVSECSATGVHGLRGSHVDSAGKLIDDDVHSTVYVDVKCREGT